MFVIEISYSFFYCWPLHGQLCSRRQLDRLRCRNGIRERFCDPEVRLKRGKFSELQISCHLRLI